MLNNRLVVTSERRGGVDGGQLSGVWSGPVELEPDRRRRATGVWEDEPRVNRRDVRKKDISAHGKQIIECTPMLYGRTLTRVDTG